MDKSASPRAAARASVLKQLKAVSERIAWLKSRWTVSSKFYDFDGERDKNGNVVIRARTESEYPENNHADWHALIDQIDMATAELNALRVHAISRWHETREEEWDRLHPEQAKGVAREVQS